MNVLQKVESRMESRLVMSHMFGTPQSSNLAPRRELIYCPGHASQGRKWLTEQMEWRADQLSQVACVSDVCYRETDVNQRYIFDFNAQSTRGLISGRTSIRDKARRNGGNRIPTPQKCRNYCSSNNTSQNRITSRILLNWRGRWWSI